MTEKSFQFEVEKNHFLKSFLEAIHFFDFSFPLNRTVVINR